MKESVQLRIIKSDAPTNTEIELALLSDKPFHALNRNPESYLM